MAQQMHSQTMMQLDRNQEVHAQVLTQQISNTIRTIKDIAAKIMRGKLSQRQLTQENEVAVALINILGSNCQTLSKDGEHNVLMIGYELFDSLRRQMNAKEMHVAKDWLGYIDAALLSKPLSKLQITRQTLEKAENDMVKGGGLMNFMGQFLGAKHDAEEQAQHVRDNADQLRAQHQQAIKRTEVQYRRRQQDDRRCPTENEVYRVSGGTHNKELAPALKSSRDRMDEMAAMQTKQQRSRGRAMDVERAQPEEDSGNAFIKSKPPQTLTRGNGKRLSIKYPYPCQVLKQLGHNMVGVKLAFPYTDVKARIALSNLETDPVAVGRLEQRHLAKLDGQGLGYTSVNQMVFQ